MKKLQSWPIRRGGVSSFAEIITLVISQMRGEIDCKAPELQILRHKVMDIIRSWPIHELRHLDRDWNPSAYRLTSKSLQLEKSINNLYDQDRQDLRSLNRLNESLTLKSVNQVVKLAAFTR